MFNPLQYTPGSMIKRNNAIIKAAALSLFCFGIKIVQSQVQSEIYRLEEEKKKADINRKNKLELLKIECNKTNKECNNLFDITYFTHHPITTVEHELAWIVISLKNPQVYSMPSSYQIFDNYESFYGFLKEFIQKNNMKT